MNIISVPLGYLMYICYKLVSSYGLAIIIFTIITKIILFPLSIKQQKSSAMISAIQPKIKELQKKYKDDRVKQQEEMLKLYKENGISHTAGCLPLLIQMPILFGLIDVIYNPLRYILQIPTDVINKAIEVAKNSNLVDHTKLAGNVAQATIKSLIDQNSTAFQDVFSSEQITAIKNLNVDFLGFNLSEVPTLAFNLVVIIPLLSVITMCLSQYFTMKLSGSLNSTGAGIGKGMIAFSAVFSFSFSFAVPIGVTVYWTTSSLIQILQSFILYKIYDPKQIKKQIEENIKKREKEKKNRTKVIKIDTDGQKEKKVSEKEYNKLRLEKARELDKQKYGDEDNLPTFSENENKKTIKNKKEKLEEQKEINKEELIESQQEIEKENSNQEDIDNTNEENLEEKK